VIHEFFDDHRRITRTNRVYRLDSGLARKAVKDRRRYHRGVDFTASGTHRSTADVTPSSRTRTLLNRFPRNTWYKNSGQERPKTRGQSLAEGGSREASRKNRLTMERIEGKLQSRRVPAEVFPPFGVTQHVSNHLRLDALRCLHDC
jgi:hypothetical protein